MPLEPIDGSRGTDEALSVFEREFVCSRQAVADAKASLHQCRQRLNNLTITRDEISLQRTTAARDLGQVRTTMLVQPQI